MGQHPTEGPIGRAAPGVRARIGLFVFDAAAEAADFVAKIPEAIEAELAEVVLVLDGPSGADRPRLDALGEGRPFALHCFEPPRASTSGAARKAAFEYALGRGLDFVIVMSGEHPPSALPETIEALRKDGRGGLLVTRRAAGVGLRGLQHRATAAIQNRILGLRLSDYQTSFRAYPVEVLRRIPFQLNGDGSEFDAEILIQLRALGVPIVERALLDGRPGDGTGWDDVGHAARSIEVALSLRLHQAHLTRDGRYLVDHDVRYTLKLSETSSHMQIVSAIAPGADVLDLGCSQGLLARPLADKNVRVVGVDVGPGAQLAEELAAYYRSDLEEPLDLPIGREFDYVVCADVIEHLRNRTQLLRSARRYLKREGRLIISTPNVALWFYRLSLLVGRFEYGPRGVLDETHVHLFTGSTFRRAVERAGFQVVRQRVTALPFEVVFQSTGRSRLVKTIAGAYHLLARLWPSMFAYQFVLEATITTLDEEAVGAKPSARG